ncbi:MAG: hypothetical protein K5650_06855 [Bacteroidales bacterium]|nr:hypothetical protein [Bacteroidales bacterium]
MKQIKCILLVLTAMLFVGCEVDFSPNAEWKEVPVVYCVLDQDDDTTWVRIEKCYMSEGDFRQYGTVSDSINYPEGALQVTLLAINNTGVVDSMDFTYTLRNRDEGSFVSGAQPVYFCYTKDRLRDDCYYALVIRRTADNSVLASASTYLIVSKTHESWTVIEPNDNLPFGFWTKKYCNIVWRAYDNARLYQPIVRFYYKYKYLDNDLHYIDLPCNQRLSTGMAETFTVQYHRDAFLKAVGDYFADDTNTKVYPMLFDIYINMCNEPLYAYMQSVSTANYLDRGVEVYTNISGGLGVFGSRRTHVYRQVPGDDDDRDVGVRALLKSLGVGFCY